MTDIVKNVASNARPQINIKRKKIVKVQEGHTGAWKVAYADFVTTMMAFFMLMWLMNATTEKQKTGLADYFSPTLSINRSVSGGDNHFKGATIFGSLKLAKTGTGQSHAYESTSKTNGTEGHARKESDAENKKLEALEKMIMAPGGESDFKIFVEKSTDMDDEDTNAPNAASEKELSIDELKERMSRFIRNVEEGILDEMDFSFLELIKAEFGENFLEKLSMLDQEDAIIVSFVGLPAQNPSIFTEAGKIAFALNRKMPTVPTKWNINHEGHATRPMISGDELPSGSDVSTSKENRLPRDAISTITMQRNDTSQWKAQKTVQINENYLPAFYDKKVSTLIETRAVVNGNAHTHAAPSSEHPPLLTQMITPIIKSITQNGQTELSVILQPAELGRLKISLSGGENAQLNVNISADQQDTLGLLKRHLDQLRNSLVDLGFENLAFSFSQNTNAQTQLEEVEYITAENDTMPSDTALIPLTYMPASGPLKLDIRL